MLHVIELIPKRIALELPKEAIARRRNRAKSKMSELQEQYGFSNGDLLEGPSPLKRDSLLCERNRS